MKLDQPQLIPGVAITRPAPAGEVPRPTERPANVNTDALIRPAAAPPRRQGSDR